MPFELTRVKLKNIVDAFQLANYPTMEVNYRGRVVTDIENITNPVIFVEFSFRKKTLGLPTNHFRIEGEVLITHYAKNNSGSKIFSDYSSKLSQYMDMQTIDGVTFEDLSTFDGTGIPGLDGTKNVINYEVEYFR